MMLATVPAPRPAGFGSWPEGGREFRGVLPGASELSDQREAAGSRLPHPPLLLAVIHQRGWDAVTHLPLPVS